jgi:hypothetical protein
LAATIAGFVDMHSAAISVASLVASGKMSAADAIFPILAGLSTNTIGKMFQWWAFFCFSCDTGIDHCRVGGLGWLTNFPILG